MKELRILHTADWHADSDPKKLSKFEDSVNQIVDYCKKNKVHAIVHAGDIWEKRQSHDGKSGVPLVYAKLRELSKLVDFIFITKGNNSHDEPGSVALLHHLEPNIYAYEYPVVLGISGLDSFPFDLLRTEMKNTHIIDYIVSLVPYPTKSGFITETSIDNNNHDFLEKFEQVFQLIGDTVKDYSCPKVLAFHGNVVGSRLSTGQTLVSQDIMVAPRTLEQAQHDYYALGHIHLRQEVKPNMVYSGSIYNKNWGETEQKSFEVISFSDGYGSDLVNAQIMIDSAIPMVKLEAEFDPEYGFVTKTIMDNPEDSEIRYRVTVRENDKKLITEEKIKELTDFFEGHGNSLKIEFNIVPDQRESRSEQIMNCRTLLDEVVEYSKVIEFELSDPIKQKVMSIEGEEVLA